MWHKIELISGSTGKWHWLIMKNDGNGWFNAGHGLEDSYDAAARKAKEEFEEMNGIF